MAIWNEVTDRELYRLVESNEDQTWAERALILSAQLGVPITADSARNRYQRIVGQIAADKAAPPQPSYGITIPPVPEGDFVGFTMAFFDIETDGLSAWNHQMTVASIVDNFGRMTSANKFEFEQSNVFDDKGLVVWLRDELEKYDITVGWYSTQFDLPFVNAKLLEYGERPIRDHMHLDPIYKARGGRYGIKVGSSKLKNVSKFFGLEEKPEIEWMTFKLAAIGDPDALAEVIERNRADVRILRQIFHHLKPMVRTIHR